MNKQLYIFFIYIVSGVIVSMIFDIFRVLRKSIKTPNWITYIEDTIFWIIVGFILIWEIFTISYGELRAYIFIGLILGIVIYLITISKYFIKINVKIINFFKPVIIKLTNIIRKIASKCIKIAKITSLKIHIIILKIKNSFIKITSKKLSKIDKKKHKIG